MDEPFDCWKCGASIGEALSLPIARNDSCPNCRAELCVCRLCCFYDPSVADQCREPIAERVTNKERANFCGYFQLNHHAYSSNMSEQKVVKSQLDALFGGASEETGADDSVATPPSADTIAKVQLDQLFKSEK